MTSDFASTETVWCYRLTLFILPFFPYKNPNILLACSTYIVTKRGCIHTQEIMRYKTTSTGAFATCCRINH
ncbi:unnamed protein product [Coffea canephora]|uniref:Uncharacterized protein n=1 Tax=Coffea canephora TaxID=49390 RepID=A0A068V6I8_COFCA|nr:unnamed protein product [Coffea canephora]